MRHLLVLILMTGCLRDSMVGDWEGDLECNGIEYEVTARFFEDSRFVYSGQMLFQYEEEVVVSGENATFSAQLLYEFTTEQTAASGGQDIYLDMIWTKLYCDIDYENGDSETGGCQNIGGIDDDSKGEKVGYVEWRYSGSDRLTIDDDNCEGTLEMENYAP